MLAPAATGFGVPLLVTARSQSSFTPVKTVVLLLLAFGSEVVALTEEFAVRLPWATVDGTFTTKTMFAVAPDARLAESLQVTVPAVPTAGVIHVQPAGASTDWNVVLVGVASVKLAPAAGAGPLLVMFCV